MATPYATLVKDAVSFLTELSGNNSRDWFTTHKPRYEADLKGPALALLDNVGARWGAETGQALTPKLFRPNRDVRFSKDKTPYHTHLHMLWAETDGPSWFFGIAPGYVTAGAGYMGFDKARIDLWRLSVDGPDGPALSAELAKSGARTQAPELKRVPAPYDKDHPLADLLRRKSMTLWHDFTAPMPDRPLDDAILEAFTSLRPAIELLRRMV